VNIRIDTHVHTFASGHAYSTFAEYLEIAKKKGIEMFALTDHGPEMPGASHIYHLANQKEIPSEIDGIEVLKGVEANIMSIEGNIDIPGRILQKLDLVIGSLHPPCIRPMTRDDNTLTLINTIKSGNVDIIGHSGNVAYEIHQYEFVKAAKEYGVAIEINSGSFIGNRKGSWDNCVSIARIAKELGAYVTTGSDSHIHYRLGDFEKIYKIFDTVGFPIELVITESKDKLKSFLKQRR
jgi:putative hydrolase